MGVASASAGTELWAQDLDACSLNAAWAATGLVRRLVELHGSSVEARSKGLGRGATFEIALPMRASAALVAAPPAAERRQRRVAVIDDNPDIRKTMEELLSICARDVTLANDGVSGLGEVLSAPRHCVGRRRPAWDGLLRGRARRAAGGSRRPRAGDQPRKARRLRLHLRALSHE